VPFNESFYSAPHRYPRQLPVLYEKMSPDFRGFVGECLRRSPVIVSTQPSAAVSEASAHTSSLTAQLAEIEELKRSGLITEAEFQAKRKKIIEAH
jgi:hypothetical protein